jgi:uncharacterized protein (TIGR03000 family)
MFLKVFSFGGLLLLAGAMVLVTPDLGQARGSGGHGGGGFRGGHVGGAHFGGFRGGHGGAGQFGGYRGGFYGHPYAHYGYGRYFGGYGGYYPFYGTYNAYPYYGNYGYYNPSSYALPDGTDYSGSYGDATPSYLDRSLATVPQAGGYQSYYPSAAGQADTSAHVTVTAPPDTRLWFENTLTTSTGPVREFNSPPLTPGNRYSYEVKASWNENGQEVTQTQRVAVTPGAHVNVTFPTQSKTAAQASAGTHR